MEIVYHGKWLWDSPYDGGPEDKDYTQGELDAIEAMKESSCWDSTEEIEELKEISLLGKLL
jgi:hypothetical protein